MKCYIILYCKIILLQFSLIKCIIKLPINIEMIDDKNYTFSTYFLNKKVTTEIKIGNPNQIIRPLLIFNESNFYILKSSFNTEKSLTYKELSETSKKHIGEKVVLVEESFIFNNEKKEEIKINNLPFLLIKTPNKNTIENCLGLSPGRVSDIDNIFNSIKKYKVLNSTIFTIKFDKKNKNKGELIIGGYPSEYDKNYNDKYFEYSNVEITEYEQYWKLNMDKFYYGDTLFFDKYHLNVDFDIRLNGIVAIEPFFTQIDLEFFNDYVNSEICSIYENNQYLYYICEKNIDLNKLKYIKLYSKDLNYTFELDAKNLYEEINGRYIFLIFFDKSQPYRWTLGIPFLRKYQMVFNIDKRIIGFYTQIDNLYFNISILLIVVIIIVLVIILFFLIFLYFKLLKYKSKRKIRSNEINEIYDYSPNYKNLI